MSEYDRISLQWGVCRWQLGAHQQMKAEEAPSFLGLQFMAIQCLKSDRWLGKPR